MRLLIALALSILSTFAFAAPNMPARKPGLWEISMQMPNLPQPMVSQQCIDEKTDNLMQQRGQEHAQQQCSKNTVRNEGSQVVVDSECQFDKTTATTHAVFSGDFKSAYRGEINTTYAPPMHGMASSRQTLSAKWLGPCKAGQKPGDVIMPGMGNININELMKSMPRK